MRRLALLGALVALAVLTSPRPTLAQTVTPVRYGDLDGDGRVAVSDVLAVLSAIVARPTSGLSLEAADVAPMNSDGTFGDGRVDLGDALRLLRRVVGLNVGLWPGAYAYGFEESLEGWVPDGTDLDDPPIQWKVEHASDAAFQGQGSARFFLDNMNDAGKIWLERPFAVEPNTRYRATVTFQLQSSDFGDVNLWSILGYVGPTDPEQREQMQRVGSTGIGELQGPVWVERAFTTDASSDTNGVLWVALGIWGTHEVARTYHVDALRVRLEPLPQGEAGAIQGRVKQPAGTIVAALAPAGKGQTPAVFFAVPDSQTGSYTLGGLPAGAYTVVVSSSSARPQGRPEPVQVQAGQTSAGVDFDLSEPVSTPKQVEESVTVPLAVDGPVTRQDLPIHPDMSNPEGPAKMDVSVLNTGPGTARVSMTFRYPRTADIQIDEILDVIELKVWSGSALVDYVPIIWEEVSAEPPNPGDTIPWEATVRVPTSGQDYRLEVVLWGNYE